MQLTTQPYKGARDFYPEDKRLQNYIFKVWRSVVENFGYEEYDAPILEPLAIYKAKTGEEIVNEQTYHFKDRGGREVAMRPEMTPTVSRLVAGRRQQLAYPLRWYSIPNIWRYERPQRGRLREHWQLNVDLFGIEGLAAEHEIITIANEIMLAFGAKANQFTIKLNSRKLLQAALRDYLELSEVQTHSLSKLLDRRAKMSETDFNKSVAAIFKLTGHKSDQMARFLAFLQTKSLAGLPAELKSQPSWNELQNLLALLSASGTTNVVYDATLMRGFDYYTDIVFEIFDTDKDNNRSLFGGGRYDGLVSLFGVDAVPTVGFGMGDVTLLNFLEAHNLVPQLPTSTNIYVVLIGDVYQPAQKIITALRAEGLNVAVDPSGKKAERQIKSALKKAIPFALFIGQKELDSGKYNLKNLATSKEQTLALSQIAKVVKDLKSPLA